MRVGDRIRRPVSRVGERGLKIADAGPRPARKGHNSAKRDCPAANTVTGTRGGKSKNQSPSEVAITLSAALLQPLIHFVAVFVLTALLNGLAAFFLLPRCVLFSDSLSLCIPFTDSLTSVSMALNLG